MLTIERSISITVRRLGRRAEGARITPLSLSPSQHCSDLRLRPKQLTQVVRQCDQAPLRFDLAQTAQQKLPEASRPFDLPQDRFHDAFALVEGLPADFRGELALHAPAHR